MRWFLGFLLVSLSTTVWADCLEPGPGGPELAIEGLGTVYFTDLAATLQRGIAELSGGVCIAGETSWTLQTETLQVENIANAPKLSAAEVQVSVAGWTLHADALTASRAEVSLEKVRFRSGAISGTAAVSRIVLSDATVELSEVSALGSGFRIEGALARLDGERLLFEDALATTCVCGDEALYVVRAPEASYDLTRDSLAIQDGRLTIGGIVISLNDLVLTPQTLTELTFPIKVEYVTGDPATGRGGTGLGIRVPAVPLAEGLGLELGVVGLDTSYPLNGIFLIRYRDDKVRFEVGKAAEGAQADLTVSEDLAPGLVARYGITNHHWQAEDYLHEGWFELAATRRFSLTEIGTVDLSGIAFAAVSSQQLASRIITAPRLGSRLGLNYRSAETPLGRFSLRTGAEVTTYPGKDRLQYGVTFRPSWSFVTGDLRLSGVWSLLWTNAASPFSKQLDRLEPQSLLSFRLAYTPQFGPKESGDFSANLRYDFLDPGPPNWFGERIDVLALAASVDIVRGDATFVPFVRAELAPLLNPNLVENTYLEGGFDVTVPAGVFGFSLRLEPSQNAPLQKVETRASFPLHISQVTVEPFLALDFLPTLQASAFPRVSGHGLSVTWASCCGTVNIGYRAVENTYSTSFSLRFNE